MGYVSSEPLESELRQRTVNALRGVSEVTRVEEKGREEWFLAGTTSGNALVAAVAQVVDDLADQIRAVLLP